MPPCLILAVTVSVTFLVFDDVDSFEEYWSGILWYTDKSPQLGGVGRIFFSYLDWN